MGIFDDLVNIEDISIEKKQEENRQQEQQEEGNKSLKNSLYGDAFRKTFGDPR